MNLWSAVTRRKLGPNGHVVAHILDPITGYSNRDLEVGKDIDADIVRRLGDNGAVFVLVDYEGGAPSATVCNKAQWLRAKAKQDVVEKDVDAWVWRKREELEVR